MRGQDLARKIAEEAEWGARGSNVYSRQALVGYNLMVVQVMTAMLAVPTGEDEKTFIISAVLALAFTLAAYAFSGGIKNAAFTGSSRSDGGALVDRGRSGGAVAASLCRARVW